MGSSVFAQTTFTTFTDNYNRGTLSPGGTPSSTYTTSGSGNFSSSMSGSTMLQLTVTGNAFSAANGTSAATVPLSGFTIPFRSALNTNAGTVTWTFNMRTDVASSGFASGSQMLSVVLAGNNSALAGSGSGYAVAFTTGANKGVQLIRYNGAGLQGANTVLITPASNMITNATDYLSVKVTYVPSTNTWSLFLRDDGTGAFTDPATGAYTQVASSIVDATYTTSSTSPALSVAGFIGNYRGAALLGTRNGLIDNFSVLVTCNAPTGVTATASTTTACTGSSFSLAGAGTSVATWAWSGPSGYSSAVQNPTPFFPALTAAGTYSLIATTSAGCPAFANTGAIGVTTTPTISVTSSSNTYCVGSPALTLSVSGASGYTWTPNPGNLTSYTAATVMANPTVTTTYTVVGANANCTHQLTKTITIIGTAPVFSVSPASSSIGCPGAGVSVTASSASSLTYTWSPATALSATTGTTITASPTSTTTYTITGTDAGGCADVRTSAINILAAVPSAPSASSITTTSVHLAWTAVSGATGYTMKAYTNVGLTTLAASATSATNSGDITTLSPNTAYWIIIVADIGSGCYAPNSASVQVTTPVGLPYWESFESISSQNAVPTGWLATTNAGSFTPKYADNNTSGVTPFHGSWDYMFIGNVNSNTNANNWLVSPGMPMVAGTTYNVSFNYNVRAGANPATCLFPGNGTASLTAYLSDNGTLPGTGASTMSGSPSTLLSTGSIQNTGWITPTTMTFTAPSTGTYYLGIKYVANQTCTVFGSANMSPDAAIDNIRICKNPSAPTGVSATPNPICATNDLTLSATTASGYNYYTWSGPASFSSSYTGSTGSGLVPSIGTSGSGIYTITVGSDPYYTCSSAGTTSSVTVIPLPVAITPSDTVICAGATYTLGGGNPASGTAWSSAPSGNVTITSGGVVTGTAVTGIGSPVTITYNTGCGTPTTATVKTVNSLGGTYSVGVGQQFPTLSDAVAIYNCATSLTGPVVFQLTDASYPNEAYPITINSNSSASSTNTLTIKPASGMSPTLSASSATALFNVNGKYIIFDGSNAPVANAVCPSSTSSRDLTISNTNAGTSSAVIWLGSGANNDTVRNCIISGSGAAQTLVGIGSGGASIAVNSVGASNNNNAVVNNAVSAVQNGIYSMGASAGSKNTGTVINQNTVTNTGNNGIMVGFESGINIRGNIVTGVTSSTAGRDVVGINIGFANNGVIAGTTSVIGNEVSDAVIGNNVVGSITSTAAVGTQSAVGIAVAGTTTGTANTIVNNSVYKPLSLSNTTDITAGIFLSGITSGIADKVWYNTVALSGTPGGGTGPSFALAVSGVASPIEIKNNILVNAMWNSTANSARALGLAYSSYGSLSSNYNVLRDSSATAVFVSVGSLTAPTTTYASIAAWQTGSGSTQDMNSVLAIPTFNSPAAAVPDLGLSYAASNISINNAGTPISYTSDANCATRNASTPDIGINEFNGSAPPPTIVYTAIAASGNCPTDKTITATIAIGGGAPTSLDITTYAPRVYFSKDNITWYSNAGTYVSGSTAIGGTSTWNFTITAATMGLVGNETIYYYVVAQDQSSPAGVGSLPTGVVAPNVSAITAAPTPNTYVTTVSSGTYYVGTGQDFSTLPLAVAAYNGSACISGPITYKLTDALYNLSSTPVTINLNALASATNTLTIMPSAGVSTTITASSTTGVVMLGAGAKYIIIDGSNSPVTNSICPLTASSRNLTITNTNTGTSSAVVWMGAGANNNTVKNCKITGNASTTTLIGIGSGGASIGIASLGSSNNNIRIENNSISLVQNGIYSMGASTATRNTGTVINQNVMTASTGIGKNGILVGFDNGVTVSGNTVYNLVSTLGVDIVGINLGMGNDGITNTATVASEVINATVTYNKVDNISTTAAWSAVGIAVCGASTGTTTIANNMVSGVWSKATPSDLWAGIFIGGVAGSTTNVYYNAIYLANATTGGSVPGYGIAVTGSNPTLNIKNNIIVNNNASGSARSAMGFAYATYTGLTSSSNDLYAASGNLVGYGSLQTPTGYYTSITAWNAASGKDAPLGYPAVSLPITTPRGSVNVLPAFTSTSAPVDLTLSASTANYLLNNTGVSVSPTVTTDFDCNTRDASFPDIGVNEFTSPGCTTADGGAVAVSAPGFCVSGSPTLTLSTTTTGGGAYYQWQSSATGVGGWSAISGATNTTYSPFVTTTTYYRALVACLNTSATEQTQASATSVTIAAQPTISGLAVAPSSTSICSGASITLTGATSGGFGTPTYTWSGPGLPSTTSGASTSSVLTPTAVANVSGTFSVIVNFSGANCITSPLRVTASTYTVAPQPSVTALSLLPANTSLCSGAAITLTATASGGAGSPTYTWSGPGLAGVTGSSAVSAVLNPTVAATASGEFSVTLAYSGTGCNTTSAFLTSSVYTVSPQPSITSVTPSAISTCAGESITIATTSTGGVGTGTYTWSGAAITTTTGTSATSPVFSPTLAAANVYSVSIGYAGTGCVAAVTTTTITTHSIPAASVSAAMPNICQPTPSASIGLSSIVGSPTTYSVTWLGAALADGGFSNISGAALSGSSVTLIYNTGGGAGSFDGSLTLSNGFCTSPVYPVHTIVHAQPLMTIAAVNVPCVGYAGSIDFTGADSASVAYSVDGGSTSNFIFSGTTHSLSIGVMTSAHNYLIIDAHNAVCTTFYSTPITITPTPMAWVGGTGGAGHESEWNRITNWSCGFVPTVADDVQISAAVFNPVVPSAFTATTRNLTVSSGGVLVIDGSGKIEVDGSYNNSAQVLGAGKVVLNGASAQTITGIGTTNNLELNNSTGATINTGSRLVIGNTITITSGTLTTNDSLELASTDTNATARIAEIPSSGAAISGKVKAGQYVMGGYRRFRFFSHPFSDTMSLSQLQPYIDITGPGGTANGFRYTASNAPSTFRLDPYTENSSMGYDPGWKPFTKINASAADSNKVHPGQGIRILFRGAKGEGLGYLGYLGGYTVSPTTFKMIGNVNQGDVSIPLAQGATATLQSFNMVGNPYASPVDMGTVIWNARAAGQVMGGAFFVFDPAMGAGGQFVSVNLGGSAVPYYVQANTCIQVEADHDGAHIDFSEADKSPNTSNYLYKAPVQYTNLSVYDEKYHIWDMLKLDFNDKATDEHDRMLDASKPMGVADFNFYSQSTDNLKLAVDSRPFLAEKVIPLGLTSGYQQNFIIRADNLVVPAGGKLVLHDKLLGKYVDLNQGTEYAFTIGKDKTTQGDRFELALKSIAPVPVKPLAVSMTPNPTTDDVKINFTSGKKEKVTVSVMDISGVSIYSKDLGEQQNGTISVPLSSFAAGIYMVELTQGEQKITQRLVKE
ncbi:hypothetical protein CJD36_000475 [Flavipsychrobacter stenotrophus]|uniref:Fibronectin type-III domain-containing protein n=1 Tax=Flavipsychrobacter stenotrophus TaxID=2077091 RepID=A0A2S7T074_9BACT|nr:hypothetical protein CJD36_000475 [Flavipsychrobacter stenotrophus]